MTVTVCFSLKHHFTSRAAKRSWSAQVQLMSLLGVVIYGCALRALFLSEHISGTVSLTLEMFIAAEAHVHLSSSWDFAKCLST